MRKLQIGVIGSAADLKYSKRLERIAREVGMLIAKNDAILIFGAEKDYDSLGTAACRGARAEGGTTVGVTYSKTLKTFSDDADIVIATGLERGGGREFTLMLCCDAVISLSGGSGTLNEITVAYQCNIPVVALEDTKGWSGKLANTYLDERKRLKIYNARKPEEAVMLAVKLGRERRNKR